MLRGGMIENNLVVRMLAKDSPRHFWGISANGNTLRLHRRVESSILSSSTKICPKPLQQCTLRLSDVPTHNRIVCVRTMRNEFMTHRTLLLGREERWQYENLPVV